jgi:hypothetical protein
MSRFSERSILIVVLLGIFVFGIGTGAGAAGFVVTRSMWNGMTQTVKSKAAATTLNSKVTNLQSADATLRKDLSELQGQVVALQAANPGTGDQGDAQVALDGHVNELIAGNATVKRAAEDAGLAIARLDSVETSITGLKTFDKNLHVTFSDKTEKGLAGPHVIFEGVNVHIRNGVNTWASNGLGNLILGYDDQRFSVRGDWKSAFETPSRTGSHTLVVGPGHSWEGGFGIISGSHNYIGPAGSWANVSGGEFNWAKTGATITGGFKLDATGYVTVP